MTGIAFCFDLLKSAKDRFTPFSPSLDRIDCTGGYTKDNVRLICTALNLGLNTWGEDVYEKVATAFLEQRGHSVSRKAGTAITRPSAGTGTPSP